MYVYLPGQIKVTGCTNYSVTTLTVETSPEWSRKPSCRPGHTHESDPGTVAATSTETGVETVEFTR